MKPEPLKNKKYSKSQLDEKITIKGGWNPFGWYHQEDLKSAVEWFKKYRGEPVLFLKDYSENKKDVFDIFHFKGEFFEKELDEIGFDSGWWMLYDIWLFDKAFEDVILKSEDGDKNV